MLTCKQMTELVTDYVEGHLGLRDRIAFRMHLGMCSHCRRYVRQMKETVTTLGELVPEPIPADVQAELMACFRDWKPSDT